MSSRRAALLGASILAAAATITGCGGAPSTSDASGARSDPAHAAFMASVEQKCRPAVAAHSGHAFPVKDFDPLHPDAEKLPAVADYFARYGGLPSTTRALHGLTPPANDARAWKNLLGLADQVTANAQQQIHAARSRDVNGFVRTVHVSDRLISQIDDAGARFGFTPNSACGQVFG
jgi:hypothetical protein